VTLTARRSAEWPRIAGSPRHQPHFQVPKPFLSLTVRENIKVALAYGARP